MAKVSERRIKYTKSLGDALARAAREKKPGRFHIIANDKKWSLVSDGAVRAIKVFPTINAAVLYVRKARQKSRKSGDIVIHGRDGGVENIILLDAAA